MRYGFPRVATCGVSLIFFSAFAVACGGSVTTDTFFLDEDRGSSQSADVSIRTESHDPLLIDLGEIQSDGSVEFSYWNDAPEIINLGSYQKERELELSVSSGDVNEIILSSFQVDKDGRPHSIDTVTCKFEPSDRQGCILTQEGDEIMVTVELPSPSYATLQVVVENRAGDPPPQQSTWLL